MKKNINVLRIVVMAICALCSVWVNITTGINAGNIAGTVIFGGLFCAALFCRRTAGFVVRIWRHIPGKAAVVCAGATVFFCAGVCVYSAVNMARYSESAAERTDCVLVLGCQVKGEKPGKMLSDRLDAALEILNAEPQALCIVSGGKGRGEDISEAEAMRRYLIAHGISDDRIVIEDRSSSTYENLHFSAEILRGMGVLENITVVTSDFHQFRAHIYAAREGLDVSHHSARTFLPAFMNNAVRELCALAVAYTG